MEGYFLFTVVPLAVIFVLIIRYVNEGLLRRDVALKWPISACFSCLSRLLWQYNTELLNAYFSEMVAAIQSHDGMVDKFIGDAVMAAKSVDTLQR